MVNKEGTFIDAIKNYFPSDLKDEAKHDTEIENMYYIEKLKHLLVMERDSKKFKVYNSKTGKLLYERPKDKNVKGGTVISAEYIEIGTSKLVATCQNNNAINMFDTHKEYFWSERINTNEIQTCLKWCGEGPGYKVNLLFSAGLDYKAGIHAYDVINAREVTNDLKEGVTSENENSKSEDRQHTAPITDLLPIPEMNLIASCSLDSSIILWSMRDLQFKSRH